MSGFGPQGANASTTRAGARTRYTGDTWVKDCSGAGVDDGTRLDAQFFNTIIGNLRELVRGAGVALDDDDMTMLTEAVKSLVRRTSNEFETVKLTGLLITQLPTPSAALAGSVAFCSNAAGLDYPRLVFCDGVAWRRIDNNAEVF